LLEERETKLEVLRRALQEGEASGSADYALGGILAELDAEDRH
jgi:antitoxin ParD1/3/4